MTQDREWNNLPTWLSERISKANIRIEVLGWKAKVSRIMIYYYLAGTHKPSTQAMARICKALNVPLEEALRQYSPSKIGRPTGSKTGTQREVRARTR